MTRPSSNRYLDTTPRAEDAEARELVRLLESSGRDEPRDAELRSLDARLGPLLMPSHPPPPVGGPSGPGAAAPAAGAGAGALKLKIVVTSVVAALAVGGSVAWIARTGSQQPTPRARARAPVSATAVEDPDQGQGGIAPEAEAIAPRRTKRSARHPSARSDLAAETRLLDGARAALQHGDAAIALARTTQHARAFPSGMLQEERERIAIESLVRLGRTGAARQRAERFRSRFPRSVQLRRIDRLLGEVEDTP